MSVEKQKDRIDNIAKSEMLELILQKINEVEETQRLILNRVDEALEDECFNDECEIAEEYDELSDKYDELAFMFEDGMKTANDYIDYLEDKVKKLKKKNKELKKENGKLKAELGYVL